jgi:hypothetical protein
MDVDVEGANIEGTRHASPGPSNDAGKATRSSTRKRKTPPPPPPLPKPKPKSKRLSKSKSKLKSKLKLTPGSNPKLEAMPPLHRIAPAMLNYFEEIETKGGSRIVDMHDLTQDLVRTLIISAHAILN